MAEDNAGHSGIPAPTRPYMPGYGIEAGGDASAMTPWQHVSERMAESRNYWVSTTRPDGRPHAAPVWGLWFEEQFYFGTGSGSRKGQNLEANPALVVHLESGDDVVILEGVAEKVTDSALLQRLSDAYHAKYNIRLEVSGAPTAPPIYRLRHQVVYAWLERDFPNTATRWRF